MKKKILSFFTLFTLHRHLIIFTFVLVLFAFESFSQSFTLPSDDKWHLVAQMNGRHAFLEYVYAHNTAHNPSMVKGEIQFINGQSYIIQEHQTMGYSGWNQPQFALINKGSSSELWVKATSGVNSGTFEIIYSKYASLRLGDTSDANLSDNGGTLKIYDNLPDNSHVFSGSLNVVDGKVGIGTTAPKADLDINASSPNILFQGTNNSSVRFSESLDSWRGGFVKYDNYTNNVIIGVHNVLSTSNQDDIDAIYIGRPNGKIGIGTVPFEEYQLSVKGKIRAEEVKVETGWADFVFEEDYNLRTLEEVENFIKENKHLPEIPSAEEVAKNGVNVGQMESKLLQKIEELTLYIIEQNKRITELESGMHTKLKK